MSNNNHENDKERQRDEYMAYAKDLFARIGQGHPELIPEHRTALNNVVLSSTGIVQDAINESAPGPSMSLAERMYEASALAPSGVFKCSNCGEQMTVAILKDGIYICGKCHGKKRTKRHEQRPWTATAKDPR